MSTKQFPIHRRYYEIGTLFVVGKSINNTQKMFTASGLAFLESILKNTSNILKALWKKRVYS